MHIKENLGVIAINVSLSFRYDKIYKYGDINKSIEEVCYAIIRNAKVTNDFYIIDDSYFGEFMSNFVMNNQWGIGRDLTISSFTRKFDTNFNEINKEDI